MSLRHFGVVILFHTPVIEKKTTPETDIIKRKLTHLAHNQLLSFHTCSHRQTAVHIGDYIPLHVVGLYDFKAERELVIITYIFVLYPRIWQLYKSKPPTPFSLSSGHSPTR